MRIQPWRRMSGGHGHGWAGVVAEAMGMICRSSWRQVGKSWSGSCGHGGVARPAEGMGAWMPGVRGGTECAISESPG